MLLPSHAIADRGQIKFRYSGRRRNCSYTDAMQLRQQALEDEARRGVLALQRGDFAAARDAFAVVTSSGTASPQAWLFYAQACEGIDDENLLPALDKVLAADPGNPFALLMKGDLFARRGDDRASVSF